MHATSTPATAHNHYDSQGFVTRRAWNTLQPISHLPFDVVTRIIRFLADRDPAGLVAIPGGGRRLELGWIRPATHVYSHWRNCALNDHALWARSACEVPTKQIFDVLSDRAGSMPLVLSNLRRWLLVEDVTSGSPVVPEHFFSTFTRAESVQLALRPIECSRVASLLSVADASLSLRIVHLHARPDATDPDALLDNYWPKEYSPFETPSKSNIEDVLFSSFFIPIPTPNLISLRLFHKKERDWVPNTSELLAFISSAVRLESLWLCHWNSNPSLVPREEKLTMPRLAELVLVGRRTELHTALARHLVCPRLKTVHCDSVVGRYFHPHTHALERRDVLSSLQVSDAEFDQASCFFSLKVTANTVDVHMGDFSDYHPEDIARPPHAELASSPKIDQSIATYRPRYLSTYNASALRSRSAFYFRIQSTPGDDLDTRSSRTLHWIVDAYAWQYTDRLCAVTTLHLGTYDPPRPIDWPEVLAHFKSVHTFILNRDHPAASREDGPIAALTRSVFAGTMLLPQLHTILSDKKTPWRAVDVAALRTLTKARARCGAPPLRVRPLRKSDGRPEILQYYANLLPT
ncbi:hypothetical protein PENSPDRAFT_661223 [Peniophora sp. CONT]|nr:hypothetical protein PENSPDRAFT_661223 [Peniophora sp. CONT]